MSKFDLGEIVITEGAQALNISLVPYLERHGNGDYGDDVYGLGEAGMKEDHIQNDQAVANGRGAIYSWYQTSVGILQIITYIGDYTTILLPEEL
jgi:hypothetical protein